MINGIPSHSIGRQSSQDTATMQPAFKAVNKSNRSKTDPMPREDDQSIGDKIKAVLLKYYPYVLLALLFLGILLGELIDKWDRRNRGGDDDGSDKARASPRIDEQRFTTEPTDVHGTALKYLSLHFMHLSEQQLKDRLHTRAGELSPELSQEAREMLVSAEWEVAAISKRIPIAFTAYLSQYWSRRGNRSYLASMIMTQDSINAHSYQQAALSHQGIIKRLESRKPKEQGDIAALQLHRLTASVLQAMEFEKTKFSRPEYSRILIDTADKRLADESFDLFPSILQKYALNQRSVIHREQLSLSTPKDDDPGTTGGIDEHEVMTTTAKGTLDTSTSRLIAQPRIALPPIARTFMRNNSIMSLRGAL